MRRPLIKHVKVFASVLIKEIGLQFFKRDRSSFFGSKHIQVVSQPAGKIPSERAALKKLTANKAVSP
jgi:hypothetical protein